MLILDQEFSNSNATTVSIISYNMIGEANDYFASRLHSEIWSQATDDLKQAALNDASRIIDRLAFIGQKTTDKEWPRTGVYINCAQVTGIPDGIKIAECDIAYALLSGADPEREMRSINITSRGYSSVRVTYDPKLTPEWLMYGVPSQSAWANLAPYLLRDSSGSIRLHRVS